MKPNLLVTLADRNFIPQAKQLFSSVYWNAGWTGDYMLLAHDIPEEDLRWFREKGILVERRNLTSQETDGREPIILDKFYLLTPSFKKWKNVVFVDSTAIVRDSIDRLAEVDGFAAVFDVGLPRLRDQILERTREEFLDEERRFRLDTKAFNADILAFSTNIIKNGTFAALKHLSDAYIGLSRLHEQLIWNLFFYGRWEPLPLSYNTFPIWMQRWSKQLIVKRGRNVFHFVQVVGHRYKLEEVPAPYATQLWLLRDTPLKHMKGEIFRFVETYGSHDQPWDKQNIFYGVWKANLEKAELIESFKKLPRRKFFEP